MIQSAPYLFADARQAVAALSAYLAEWSGYLHYDIRSVHSGAQVAYDGFHVAVSKFSGEAVGFIAPALDAVAGDESSECTHCGRDNTGYEDQPCSDDCPQYWEAKGIPHPDHPES